ncbi:MAG TPA: hypothetical protein IAB47_03175 [Candidatus Scatomorpha merdigallinarum]|nr:hypothetical protein [Candidatus Scatomorpha merdigallinarum]
MKRVLGMSLALIMLLTACGVTTTPVTETPAPTPVVETPEPEPAGFDVLTPIEGADYTLSEHEISGAYSYIDYSPIMKCLDEQAMKSGSHYAAYTVSNGKLIELERHTFSQDYEFDGAVRHLEFEWCKYGEGVAITYLNPYVAINNGFDIYNNEFYSTSPERFVICFSKSDGSIYPVFANLYTGEISDVLAGVAPGHICFADMSPDGKSMVLGCRESNDAPIIRWYYEMETGKLTDITGITPKDPGAYCKPVGDGIIGFFSREIPGNAYYELNSLWRTDVSAGESEMLCVSGADPHVEFKYDRTFNRYMLISRDETLVSIDIATGISTPVSDASPYQVRYSPDSTKALLMFYDGETVTGLSVVDFEAQTLSEYPVPENFAVSADDYSYPGISWLGSGVFALDNGADGTDDPLRLWAYELQTPSGENPDEVWVYPESSAYSNAELGISIDFPESWAGHLALLENYGAELSVTVCCRELLEAESAPEYSIIFAVLSADRNDAAALRRFDDPECFTLLGERGDLVYYYSNAYGRIKGAELWYKDVWEVNKPLLTDMAARYDTLMNNVKILPQSGDLL